MADVAANVRVFDVLVRFCAVRVYSHAFPPQKTLNCGAEHHAWAAVVHKDDRNRAVLAEDGFPFTSILLGLNQAAFFKIPTAVVIPIEVTAFATVGRFH